MLNQAVIRREIVGVDFRDIGLATLHTMFADNLSLIIRATMLYIPNCQNILQLFGTVSGLRCIWEQSTAAFIPDGPPPAEFWLLPWQWEDLSNASSLLGFPVAASFSVQLMESQTLQKTVGRPFGKVGQQTPLPSCLGNCGKWPHFRYALVHTNIVVR